jgi:hypothetical protein
MACDESNAELKIKQQVARKDTVFIGADSRLTGRDAAGMQVVAGVGRKLFKLEHAAITTAKRVGTYSDRNWTRFLEEIECDGSVGFLDFAA